MKCLNCGAEIREGVKFCPKCGAKTQTVSAAPVAPEAPAGKPSVWPEWQIVKQLGRGSFGVVYQAVRNDSNVESTAAIKVISIPSDASEVDTLLSEGFDLTGSKTYFKGIVDDFVREIQLMESLKGIQNIVSIEDYKVVEKQNEIGWDIYIRMELLTPFNKFICDKNFNEAEVVKFGCDICSALEICDRMNVIHRDIKPENIFVNNFGHYKLGDFGIARKLENVTGGLSQKGTANYMAPEVANSKDYDARVDTYSLGIVLYRLLNGNRVPFISAEKQLLSPNDRREAVERRIRGEALPAPCDASPEMAEVILKACAFRPEDRFESATQMKSALRSIADGTYKSQKNNNPPVQPAPPVQRAVADSNDTTVVPKQEEEKIKVVPVVSSFDEDEPKKNKKNKKKGGKAKLIVAVVAAAIIVPLLVLTIVFFTSPAYSVYKDMKDGKIEDALEQYLEEVDNKQIQEAILDVLLKDRVNEVVADYNSGKLDYEKAAAELAALEKMGIADSKDVNGAIKSNSPELRDLVLVDSYGYEYKKAEFTDSYGYTYDEAYIYDGKPNDPSYSTHNLDKAYKTFSGSVVVKNSAHQDASFFIKIYVDDVCLYEKSYFTKTEMKMDFSIDVSDAQKLEIVVNSLIGSRVNKDVALVNVELSK